MTLSPERIKSAVVALGPPLDQPWWWKEVSVEPGCVLDYRRVVFRNKGAREVTTSELPGFLTSMLPVYFGLRRRYDFVFTFECDLTTFAISFWQSLLLQRRPRHVVLQFIMRERTNDLRSRLKYLAMKWCFSSIHKVVCSSTAEAEYYREVFGWPPDKTGFVPIHTSSTIEAADPAAEQDFVVAAGRTFRDYPTFLEAVTGSAYRIVVVASRDALSSTVTSTQVDVFEDIPAAQLDLLIRRAAAVVVPLQDRRISAGQLVILHAMAAGKAVIATRTSATMDYITHEENGLLVSPGDPVALRMAIDRLMQDPDLRLRLGRAARRRVQERHLPQHYLGEVRRLVVCSAS